MLLLNFQNGIEITASRLDMRRHRLLCFCRVRVGDCRQYALVFFYRVIEHDLKVESVYGEKHRCASILDCLAQERVPSSIGDSQMKDRICASKLWEVLIVLHIVERLRQDGEMFVTPSQGGEAG